MNSTSSVEVENKEAVRTYNCGKKRVECEAPTCTKVPVFNHYGVSRGRYCKAHKYALAPRFCSFLH